MVMDPVSVQYQPDADELEVCFNFGQEFADFVK